MLPLAQCSSMVVRSSPWLGQLWPFCPICVSVFLASVPACHVLEIKYAVLSLVRPANKGACVLQEKYLIHSAVLLLYAVSCILLFPTHFLK